MKKEIVHQEKERTLVFVRAPFEGMGWYKPPHLGVATLYAFLKIKFTEINYYFVDAVAENLTVDETYQKIVEKRPDLVLFTVKTVQANQTIELIELIKKEKNIKVICGGNHASVDAKIFIDSGADYVVIGEGEVALEKIIFKEWFGEKDIECENNIVTSSNVDKCNYRPCLQLEDEEIATPDWSIMDLTMYNENIHLNKDKRALPIMASRGCPFQCDFCSTHLTWTTTVRYRKPLAVKDEIVNNIKRWGISDMHFYDDNLMLNREWLCQFLLLIENAKIQFDWICLSRPDIIVKNQDMLPRMKKCGCKGFELGFETENEDVYNKMNKKNNKEIFRQAYDIIKDNKFEMIEFLVMCYYEGETMHSLYNTYKQLNEYKKKQDSHFISSRYFATPFQGTVFSQNVDTKGILIDKTNKYKYAIFLNFIPFSFIESSIERFQISKNKLKLTLVLDPIEFIINKKEFENLSIEITIDKFIEIYNTLAQRKSTIKDLYNEIAKRLHRKYSEESIYEFIGKIIEYAVRKGGVIYQEDSIL